LVSILSTWISPGRLATVQELDDRESGAFPNLDVARAVVAVDYAAGVLETQTVEAAPVGLQQFARECVRVDLSVPQQAPQHRDLADGIHLQLGGLVGVESGPVLLQLTPEPVDECLVLGDGDDALGGPIGRRHIRSLQNCSTDDLTVLVQLNYRQNLKVAPGLKNSNYCT
jgi:hypothetical protein